MAGATAPAIAAPATRLAPYVSDLQAVLLGDDPGGAVAHAVTGTLVFADISGFTPLTERLARQGRIGAERLTDVINDVFAELMRTAGGLGGDLLKYGGDALLLLFTGVAHAERGAAAASEMQRALRAWVRGSPGRARLRMSVGVNTGDVDVFHVGSTHRELVVAGPATTATCALESAADAGEILVGIGTAAALGGSVGPAKADGHLLRGAVDAGGHRRPPTPPRASSIGIDVGRAVPQSLRSHLGRLPDGEHRLVHVAFVQFKGVDDLVRSSGAPAAAEALHSLVSSAEQACAEHGVTFLCTDVDSNGGKLVMVTGAPAAGDDDGDRLAVAVRQVLGADHGGLAVRAGANRGRLFALDVGTDARRTYTVMGDGMNLAARVMGRAQPGQLVATRALLDGLRAAFDTDGLAPFMVKGKSHPIDAAVVGAPRAARGPAAARLGVDLVGRDEELAAMRAALSSARAGSGRAVVLVGGPGIGKSRLLEELVRSTRDVPVVRVEGAQFAVAHPYFAVRGAFRSLVGAGRDDADDATAAALTRVVRERAPGLEPWLPLLALPFGIDLPHTAETAAIHPGFRRRRVHAVVTEFLDAVLGGPVLVAVEDAHWLDDASADLLRHLVGLVDARPWAVCVTRRPTADGLDLAASDAVTVLPIGALRPEAAATFVVRALADDPLPPHVVSAIAERSGGNPLFLQELVAAARDGAGVDELPETVEALIASRLDVLDPGDRDLLRSASVFGQRFEMPWLAAVVERPADDVGATLAGLGEFVEREHGSRWRFRHALLREGAYEGLSFRRRRALHARAGREIEHHAHGAADGWSDVLSLHFERAGIYDLAWRYACTAGDRARRGAANIEAATLYARALDAARRLDDLAGGDVATVAEALGDVSDLAARYADAAAAYRQARDLRRDDGLARVALLQKEGWIRERTGRYSMALRWYRRALAELEPLREEGDPVEVGVLRAQLTLACGAVRLRQGRYRECLAFIEEAAGRARTLGDRKTEAHCYYLLYWVYSDLGDATAERYRHLPLPIYEELGDHFGRGNVLNNLGMHAHVEGRWTEALDLLRRSRDARELAGDVVQVGVTANNIGEVLLDQGHLAEAEALFREALQLWVATSYPVGVGVARYNLARVATRRGDVEGAAALLRASHETLEAIEAHHLAMTAQVWELERLVAAAETADALALAGAIVATMGHGADVPLHLRGALARLTGSALAQAGDFAAARDKFDEALDAASARRAEFEIALTYDALARVGAAAGWDGVERWRADADAVFARLEVVSTLVAPVKEAGGDPVTADANG